MGLNIDIKNLKYNFLSLLTLRVGNYIIPLLTLPYLISVLGIDKFGLVAFAEMVIMYFKSVVDYGFDLTGTRSVSEKRENKVLLNKLVCNIFAVKIILCFLCFLFLICLIWISPELNEIGLLLIYSYGIVLGNALLPIWFFQGMEKMKYITMVNFLSKIIYIVLIFLFINHETDFIYVPLLNSGGLIVGGIFSILIMRRNFNIIFHIPKSKEILMTLREDFNIFITTLAPNLYNNSMGVLLGVFTNNAQVGYYSAATKLIEVGNSFIYIMSTTIFPYLNRSNMYRKKLINGTLVSGALISLIFLIFGRAIVSIIFDDSMDPSILILQILSLCPFLIAVMSVYGTNTLVLEKRDKLVRNVILIYSLLGFLFGLIFIRDFGIISAAIILVLIRALIGLTEFIIVKFNNRIR